MTGRFGHWQPRYAQLGIPTFPVSLETKKPAVGNYLRAGLPASTKWAEKFAAADAFGFACGPRSGLTILDIDDPSEDLLTEALSICGETPIIVRTQSGGHHLYYRYNDERRRIKPAKPKPIDLLGAGGLAIAPPSLGGKGAYEFVRGSLHDLPALDVMKSLIKASAPFRGDMGERIGDGERNDRLFGACMMQARNCVSFEDLATFGAAYNRDAFVEPLPDAEVEKTVRSAWSKEVAGENWFGTGRRVVLPHHDLDRLMPLGPDSVSLLLYLRRCHWNRDFHVANAMASEMPDGKWATKRLAAARKKLIDAGELIEVRPASMRHGPAVYRFR